MNAKKNVNNTKTASKTVCVFVHPEYDPVTSEREMRNLYNRDLR